MWLAMQADIEANKGLALVGHGMSQDLEMMSKWGINVPEGVCVGRGCACACALSLQTLMSRMCVLVRLPVHVPECASSPDS
jgi:hypothetical protein